MQEMEAYLSRFREGDRDGAFFGLLEMGHEVLPALIEMFRTENDCEARAFLVEVVWQYRQPSTISFLEEALRDTNPDVWRQALDGLVMLASPSALDALRSARARPFASQQEVDDFRQWIDEAIEQVEAKLQEV